MLRLCHLKSCLMVLMVSVLGIAGAAEPFFQDGRTDGNIPKKYIVKDGLPQGKLYLPENCGRAIQFAAQELRDRVDQFRPSQSGDFSALINVHAAWEGCSGTGSRYIETTPPLRFILQYQVHTATAGSVPVSGLRVNADEAMDAALSTPNRGVSAARRRGRGHDIPVIRVRRILLYFC